MEKETTRDVMYTFWVLLIMAILFWVFIITELYLFVRHDLKECLTSNRFRNFFMD